MDNTKTTPQICIVCLCLNSFIITYMDNNKRNLKINNIFLCLNSFIKNTHENKKPQNLMVFAFMFKMVL